MKTETSIARPGVLGVLTLCALTACNLPQPQSGDAAADASEDRFHEKSFSWDDGNGKVTPSGTLAKTQVAATRFETPEKFQEAVLETDKNLQTPGYSDSLWKPIDYACDELALGLWNKYGTITVGDSVVLDEASLKQSCRYVGDDEKLGKRAKANDQEGAVVDDRQYPYKMIGESWDSELLSGTGSSTQFKKRRSRFGITGWYDTDASRIGVRIYLLDCTTSKPKICAINGSHNDWYKNDDYVSKRALTGVGNKFWAFIPSAENGWTLIPRGAPFPGTATFVQSDAVIGMHSVEHAGLSFRAVSTSGRGPSDQITYYPGTLDYVTW